MSAPAPNRRRFRFSVRAMFVASLLLASWLAYYANWIHQRHLSEQWIAEVFGPDDQALHDLVLEVDSGTAPPDIDGYPLALKRRPQLAWSLWILGESPRRYIRLKKGILSSQQQRRAVELQRLFPEAQILPPNR